MRRTDLEFKNEVLHRAAEYKARRARRRKKLLAGACCLAVCILAAGVFFPGVSGGNKSAATADCAAPEAADQNEMSRQEEWYGQEPVAEAPGSAAGTGENNGIVQDEALPESVHILIETAGGECAVLSEEDAWQIQQYLTGPWMDDLTDCASDWTIQIDSESLSYHSECGTFNDIDHFRSLTVSEEDRMAINAILEKYGLETGFAP